MNALLRQAALAFSILFVIPTLVLAQGSLTPPGAPAPTMKTLSQIEPRFPISSAPFTITNAGSYYLTTNLFGSSATTATNAISIMTGNVTLDLNGFTLQGAPGSYSGIFVGPGTNITIRNGTITGWPAQGVLGSQDGQYNTLLERLTVSSNGYYGITAQYGVVRDCVLEGNGTGGGISAINCLVADCVVRDTTTTGIAMSSGEVRDCQVFNSGGPAINVVDGQVVGCRVDTSGYTGIYAVRSVVKDCMVTHCQTSGIYVNAPGCQILNNTCMFNNLANSVYNAGIFINDAVNRVEGNHVSASGYAGIAVSSAYTNNVVIRNTVAGNGANNYLGAGGNNDFGPVGKASSATSPWANLSE